MSAINCEIIASHLGQLIIIRKEYHYYIGETVIYKLQTTAALIDSFVSSLGVSLGAIWCGTYCRTSFLSLTTCRMSSLDYCLYSYSDLPLEVSFNHLWYIFGS